MSLLAIACIVLAALFLWRFFSLKKKKEEEAEEKGFVVIGTTILAVWLFPGSALLIIGLILIAVLFGGCGGCM